MRSAKSFAVLHCMHPQCSGGETLSPKPDLCCTTLADAVRMRDQAMQLDVVRRLREMADAEKAEADARGEAGATRASLLNRAAGMRFAADQLEAEIRGKAGG